MDDTDSFLITEHESLLTCDCGCFTPDRALVSAGMLVFRTVTL